MSARHPEKDRGPHKLISELRSGQWNIVFPDTVRNDRLVSAFLWQGSENPTRVQKTAAWMFGLMLIAMGLEFFALGVRIRIEAGFSSAVVICILFSLALLSVGIRVFRNGFPRRIKPAQK